MKCPKCNTELILVTGWGALNNQNIDKWPVICSNCRLVFDRKLRILDKKTKIFQKMMKKKSDYKELKK